MNKGILMGLVSRRLSSYKIAKELGCSRSNVVHWLKKYEIKTICKPGPRSEVPRRQCKFCSKELNRGSKFYCGMICHREYGYKLSIKDWKTGALAPNKNHKVPNPVRRYLFEKYNYQCCLCGWKEINAFTKTKVVPLEVDHINGDWKNNSEENLRLLCPNCHSLTPTYRSLNIGHGRSYKYHKDALVAQL